ncbi:ribbon-helix-helix protein, CopG family [Vibrio breoganii]
MINRKEIEHFDGLVSAKMAVSLYSKRSTFADIQGINMATTKTATLTIRVEPNLKEALRTAAHAEHRSIANMIEVMIREHCEKNGIAIDNTQKLDQRQELKK